MTRSGLRKGGMLSRDNQIASRSTAPVSCDCRPGIKGLHPLMSIVRRLMEVGSMDPKLYRTAVIVLMVAKVIIGVMTLCN